MSLVVELPQEKVLLRSSRVGIGLLNAMFGEMYCCEIADRLETVNKLSTALTALLSTGVVATHFQLFLPHIVPHLAVLSAMVSVLSSVFAWRNQALSFAKASKAYGDHTVAWCDLWELMRMGHQIDSNQVNALERECNKIADIVAPHSMNTRLARKCQARIRKEVGLS